MALYKGFSSHRFGVDKSFRVTDVDLVRLDLYNHIYTPKRSRVMMPDFGTVIPELIFEPIDDFTTEVLESELRRVVDFDPRVELLSFNMVVDEDRHLIFVSMKLFYIELNLTDDFELNITFES